MPRTEEQTDRNIKIYTEYTTTKTTLRALAIKFGISQGRIQQIIKKYSPTYYDKLNEHSHDY